ncbi:hypothetical protein [Actinomadura rubrisoli]|uniref:Uncharacterized protein n=1 Tax=Actinomadura rubrisoli TaxID=2530368 RepID=A0A4R5AQS6_9ACTN|nr:hypothetical protein [Actinomadura rubrisoli]TDD73404.1 hypothetical protein E1298_34050 [Actinomadura rubrisoli]
MNAATAVLILAFLGAVIWLIAYLSHNRLTQRVTAQAINKANAADLVDVLSALGPRLTQEGPTIPRPALPLHQTAQLTRPLPAPSADSPTDPAVMTDRLGT